MKKTNIARALFAVALLGCATGVALADVGDLKQTVNDLEGQLKDKERFDKHGATKVEISQARGWVSDATNAIKEEDERKSRRLFTRVRAQLELIDALIALSNTTHKRDQLKAKLAQQKQANAKATSALQKLQAEVRAQRAMQKK